MDYRPAFDALDPRFRQIFADELEEFAAILDGTLPRRRRMRDPLVDFWDSHPILFILLAALVVGGFGWLVLTR